MLFFFNFLRSFIMRPLSRKSVNKRHSARKFRKQVKRTAAPNLRTVGPMRGGYRF